MKLQIFMEQRPQDQTTCVYIFGEDAFGKRFVAKPINLAFEGHERGMRAEPTLCFEGNLANEFFPALHQAMVDCGQVKPVKNESIEFMKHHLEDMRRLVFDRRSPRDMTDQEIMERMKS